jgi:hypothetical protein
VSHDGLPIGSDTPHYIGGALVFASQGPSTLLALQGPYDVLYQMLEGTILLTGVPGTVLETVLPTILAASMPYLFSRLVLAHADKRTAIIVTLATPGWYAVYRLQADLHANLLALTLFLAALVLLSGVSSIREPRCLVGLSLIGLASFTHIESSLFLMSMTLASSLTRLRPFPFRVALLGMGVIAPATLFYGIHLVQQLSFTSGSLDVSVADSLGSWLVALGPLLPLVVVGLGWSILKPRFWLEIFAVTWAAFSILVGLSQYVSPQFIIFAQRAVILTPTPFLAGLGARRLSQLVSSIKTVHLPVRYLKIAATAVVFVILAVSWPITASSALPHEQIFLTSAQYKQLEWVSSNLRFSSTPVFMLNDVDEYAGSLGQQYDSWVSAIVGPHLSYLGLVDYLVQMEQTPYSQIVSRQVSGEFMQQLRNAGVTTRAALLQHPIVIASDFYRPFPLPNYTAALFTQVWPGVYVDNATRLGSLANLTLPLYMVFSAHSGDWGGVERSWAQSIYAYEVYDAATPIVEATFLFATESSGSFTLGLQYWNGGGNNLTVAVDGQTIGTIVNNNTGMPAVQFFEGIPLSTGTHSLTITVNNNPSLVRNVSLDYLVLVTP